MTAIINRKGWLVHGAYALRTMKRSEVIFISKRKCSQKNKQGVLYRSFLRIKWKTLDIYFFLGNSLEKIFHIFTIRSFYIEAFSRHRMNTCEWESMKKLPSEGKVTFQESILTLMSIGSITENRAPEWRKVDSDLMSPPCFYPTLEETIFLIIFQNTIVCYGFLSMEWIDLYLCFMVCILYARELHTDRITRFRWGSEYEGMVDLFYSSSLYEWEESKKGFLILRDHDGTTRITVEPMNECWFERERVMLPEGIMNVFYEWNFMRFVISGMNVHSSRFIQYEEMFVFIEYELLNVKIWCINFGEKMDVFPERFYYSIFEKECDNITCMKGSIIMKFFSIHFYFPSAVEAIDWWKRSVREEFAEESIESLVSILSIEWKCLHATEWEHYRGLPESWVGGSGSTEIVSIHRSSLGHS